MKKANRNGFTLVEVAIAVLVIAIGVLAVAALFSGGLSASSKAVADTQTSMFAENVFNGLRARSLLMAEQQTNANPAWNDFWTKFLNGSTSITISAAPPGWGVWTNVMVISNGGPYVQVFGSIPMHGGGTTGIVDHAFRYRIDAWMTNVVAANMVSAKVNGTWIDPPWQMLVTNTIVQVLLSVWDGQFGSTNATDALTFYSEFANQGNL